MDITRRVVLLSIGVAVAAGLSLPQLVEQAGQPNLAAPVELVRNESEPRDEQAQTGPSKFIRPVPVVPLVERNAVAPQGGQDDDDDKPRTGQDPRSPRGNDSEDDDDDRVDETDDDADTNDGGNSGDAISDD